MIGDGNFVAFFYFAFEEAQQKLRSKLAGAENANEPLVLAVDGMTCGGCVGKLERAFQKRNDVTKIVVSLEPGQAVIHGNISKNEACEIIIQAGFQTS